MLKKPILYLWLSLLLCLFGCTPAADNPDETAVAENIPTGTIVLGDTGVNRAEKIEALQPTADYIAAQLHEYGIGVGEVKIAPDLETMIQWINEGEVDIYFDSPYPTMIILDDTEMRPVMRQWRQGVGQYQSVIFTSNEANITTLDDLQGQIIAFEEAYSSSGFMLPYTLLAEEGFTLKEVTSTDDPVAEDEIGYIFSESDVNTVEWVISGKVIAGATDSPTYDVDIPAPTKQHLTELARSVLVPRGIVSMHSSVDPAVETAVIEILQEMEASEEGVAAMALTGTNRFDELPDGVDQTLEFLTSLFSLLHPTPN
ncbi:MAG: phosphate/phosphite/phosphonate ABC transporter substrate-binding protein [Anaerolineales bacterium]|nr:phosphate/phosphite/phosphonate ABC transporter substrate-binding protein [Anaerolineales bacterium]